MTGYRIQQVAIHRLDEIYDHTCEHWGEDQADRHIRGLFARFDAIAARSFPWRPVPAEFGVSGFVCRHQSHLIYWKLLDDGTVGIVTMLHARMHQIARYYEDFA
jgi:toxin ParE1/3/4